MAVIPPDEPILTVFINDGNTITIQQITPQHGYDSAVSVPLADVDALVEALQRLAANAAREVS